MKQNLEHFPRSDTAQRMLSRVSPIYDDSYVAKWLFEVMGSELDEVWEQYAKLRLQAFAETADDWSMDYWEDRYGIEKDGRLDLETRRSHVIAKRDTRAPMNPTRLAKILGDLSGREFVVTENVAPYVFLVDMLDGRNEVDYKKLLKLLRNIKPSHQNFLLNAMMDVIEWENENSLRFFDLGMAYHHSFYNFGRYVSFDGERYFDGSILFDQEIAKKLNFYDFCVALAVKNKMSLGQLLTFAAAFQTSSQHHFRDFEVASQFRYGTDFEFDHLSVGMKGLKHALALDFDDLLLRGFAVQNEGRLAWPDLSLLDRGWQTESRFHLDQLQFALGSPRFAVDLQFGDLRLEGLSARTESRLNWPELSVLGAWYQTSQFTQQALAVKLQHHYVDQLLRMATLRIGEVLFHNRSAFGSSVFVMGDHVSYRTKAQLTDVQTTLQTTYRGEALTGSLTKDSRHYMDGSRYFNGAIPFNSEFIEEEL